MSHFSGDVREKRFSLACEATRALLYVSLCSKERKANDDYVMLTFFRGGREKAKKMRRKL